MFAEMAREDLSVRIDSDILYAILGKDHGNRDPDSSSMKNRGHDNAPGL